MLFFFTISFSSFLLHAGDDLGPLKLANWPVRENPGHVQWTGWDMNLYLAGRKLTFNEHQLCAR